MTIIGKEFDIMKRVLHISSVDYVVKFTIFSILQKAVKHLIKRKREEMDEKKGKEKDNKRQKM